MKITDKMRLDWLQQRYNTMRTVHFDYLVVGMNTIRGTLDNAIRADRKASKGRGK